MNHPLKPLQYSKEMDTKIVPCWEGTELSYTHIHAGLTTPNRSIYLNDRERRIPSIN